MKRTKLGKTGLTVTEMCFGTLPFGPSQLNLDVDTAARLLRTAYEGGVNFIDTAQSYRTYPHIRESLSGHSGDVIIASKSVTETYADMENHVILALKELGRDHIDIFHLHAARLGPEVFTKRAGALECLVDMKKKGVIRAVGISTHSVTATIEASKRPEIDVVFPIINRAGFGILHGTRDEMLAAIATAVASGKGVYAMKAIGGGNLAGDVQDSIQYVRDIPGIAAIAVGIVSAPELAMDLEIFENRPVSNVVPRHEKHLFILHVCNGCGSCVLACPNFALSVVDGKSHVDKSKCITCGYCAPACPQFAIRLV